jgi:DNA-binding transcriptional LysR family regulator
MSTTQPALSKWLKELEDEVGAPLFERHARGLSPTGHGRVLLTHAQRVLNEMDRAQDNLAALHDSSSHRVMLGTAPASVTELVPAAVADFLRKYPKARVELHENTMRVLLQKLEQGELDVVVGSLDQYQPNSHLHSEMLYSEPMRVVARADHPLAAKKRVGWEDLFDYDWILWPQGTANRGKLDAALAQAGQPPLPCRVESSSLIANFTLLQQSDLLCVVSNRLARHFAKRLEVGPLDFALGVESSIGMCWRDEPLQEASTLEMLQSLRQAALIPTRGAKTTSKKKAGS